MSGLAYLTIAEASRLIRARKLSPVEFAQALLARIAAIDATYHAFIAVMEDAALREAKARGGRDHAREWARADAWRALCREGYFRCRRHGHHLPLQAAHRSSRHGRRHRHRAAARGRRGAARPIGAA